MSARDALRVASTAMWEPLLAASARDLPSLSLLPSLVSVSDSTESTWLILERVSARPATTLPMALRLTRMDSPIVNALSSTPAHPSRQETLTVSAVTLKTALTSAMEDRELSPKTSVCASVLSSRLWTRYATRTAEANCL